MKKKKSAWEAVYDLVREVPSGRVTTYGDIARALEGRLSARAVGWAMHVCPADLPWHRVVNAQGGYSAERLPHVPEGLQRALLESEGIPFKPDGRVDLKACRWNWKRRSQTTPP
ncbi:MAG TPA: MGMT family protein [Acidobacteriota bacterium]|jgi:methylated-DNA-protein-cysteine methyltransferase-like protein|nr:MGMT family protein [Acidobacteriota bacterium]